MSEIRWDLLPDPGAPARAFQTGVQMGREMRAERRQQEDQEALRRAIAAYSADPTNTGALEAIMQRNPELGMKLSEHSRQQQFRGALVDYTTNNAMLGMGGGQGALSGVGRAPENSTGGRPVTPALPQPNALLQTVPPASPGASFGAAFEPYAAGNAMAQAPTQDATAAEDAGGIPAEALSFLGRPESRADAAFLRMLQTDPVEALKIQSSMRESFLDRVEVEREFWSSAVDELSRMTDDAGWQRALQRLEPMARVMNVNLAETVPQAYPGPDKVRELLEGALPVKERLDLFLREANVEADNARADRNTDSQIETREARLRDQRAVDAGRLENQRRGQDITDRRQRDRPAPAGRTRGRARVREAADNLPLVRTPAEARKLPSGSRFRTPDGQVKRVP